jgi:EAL domain-containing protein (putative c-di-GMP-specific phosphodiesterase class I)
LVENIVIDDEARRVLGHIISFAKDIGVDIIAEKVHSKEVQELLVELGATYLQGYYIGKPNQDVLEDAD